MKWNIFLATILMFVAGGIAEPADSGPGTGTSSDNQVTQTVTLEPGWNSVSFKIDGLSFGEDIEPQCSFNWYNSRLDEEGVSASDISGEDRYYVWTQVGGEWRHPDQLEVSRGYTFNVDSECTIEVTGQRKRVESFKLEDGWNLLNVPSGLALGSIVSECDLRWYSQQLSEGKPADEISDNQRFFFWVNDGGSWRNPNAEKDHRGDDGVYINSDGPCTIDSWPYDGKSPSEDDSSDTDDSIQTETDAETVELESAGSTSFEVQESDEPQFQAKVVNGLDESKDVKVVWLLGDQVVGGRLQEVPAGSEETLARRFSWSYLTDQLDLVEGEHKLTARLYSGDSWESQEKTLYREVKLDYPVTLEDAYALDDEVMEWEDLVVQAKVSNTGYENADVRVAWYLGTERILERHQEIEGVSYTPETLQQTIDSHELDNKLEPGEYRLRAKFLETEDRKESEFVEAGSVTFY